MQYYSMYSRTSIAIMAITCASFFFAGYFLDLDIDPPNHVRIDSQDDLEDVVWILH